MKYINTINRNNYDITLSEKNIQLDIKREQSYMEQFNNIDIIVTTFHVHFDKGYGEFSRK